MTTAAIHCFIKLPLPHSSPSESGNGSVRIQAPCTLCNLRVDPCVGSSEVDRSGISLAGFPHITQSKLYSFLCQTAFLLEALGILFPSCDHLVTCKHFNEHIQATHTHREYFHLRPALRLSCEDCVERLGWNPRFAVKTLQHVWTRHLSSGLWLVFFVS